MPFDDFGTGTAERKCADCGKAIGPPMPCGRFRKGLIQSPGPLCIACITERLGRPMIIPDDFEDGQAVADYFDQLRREGRIRVTGTIGAGGVVTRTGPE